jgi:hypothetical protein
MISHDHRCIFVHIPKTGGSSIELLLTGYDWITENAADHQVFLAERDTWRVTGSTLHTRAPGYFDRTVRVKHATQAMARAIYGEHWAGYTKATFVRDPWARVASIYRHGLRDAPEQMPSSFAEWLHQPVVKDHVGQRVFQRTVSEWDEFDFVGRFEHFAADVAALMDLLAAPFDPAELPHETHGSTPTDHHALYGDDDELIAIVAEHSADVIERFGYTFDGAADPHASHILT